MEGEQPRRIVPKRITLEKKDIDRLRVDKAMNKTSLLLGLFLLLMAGSAFAQQYRTVELKPITQQGWKYFYDMNKVSSPEALEIPLLAVKDDEVTRYLKASRNWRTAETVVTLVPLIYLLTLPKQKVVDPETFWWTLGGTLALQLGMEAVVHVKLGKAIDKYNMLIMQPTGSVTGVGVNFTYKFR